MKTVALFDIADQSFKFYTDKEWSEQIQAWRELLVEDGDFDPEYIFDMSVDEIVELIGGDEYFVDTIA